MTLCIPPKPKPDPRKPIKTRRESEAFRYGVTDAVMERPSSCIFKGFKQESDYIAGYLYGKELRQKNNALPKLQQGIIAG